MADVGLPADSDNRFWRAVGCPACNNSGYSGRIALLEFLPVDDTIARLILRRADTREIGEAATAGGMRSLRGDGIAKARRGLTTLEEALRVTAGD
jgi:general secretion pathway protein E